jgi:hypothetical protein
VSVSIKAVAALLAIIVIGIGVGFFFVPSSPSTAAQQFPDDGINRFTGTLSGDGAYLLHSFRVNSSAVSMRVILDCGFNDFDLYLAHGYIPTEYDYDWRGYAAGGEDFTVSNPEEGIWHIMVHSYSGAGNYLLSIDLAYE